tara:strand:+ start:491 stop:865 length:375 start_codon:yes stop_codon:yes gene_type:complete
MNTKLHAITDTSGRPIRLFITAGQVSDYTGAAALMNGLPEAEWLLADRGYDADWFRETLVDKGTKPCIPGRKSRKKTVKYDKRRYKRRNRIERMFGRLKIGGVSQPVMTAAQRSSCQQSLSPQQ